MSPDKLAGVHPVLAAKVRQILRAMEMIDHPMMVTDGYRTVAEQQALYARGRTEPGHIVTQCDGVRSRSAHQGHPADGWGRAVDLCFLVDGKPSWAESEPWNLYGLMAQTIGLTWGGAWSSFQDRPHIQLEA